jgi:hypothetical protein
MAHRGRGKALSPIRLDEAARQLRHRLVRAARRCRFRRPNRSFPDVLSALRKGQTTINLSDGTVGLLPESWLANTACSPPSALKKKTSSNFPRPRPACSTRCSPRSRRSAAMKTFERTRAQLRSFEGVAGHRSPGEFCRRASRLSKRRPGVVPLSWNASASAVPCR